MSVMRVFVKPTGQVWCDVQLSPGQDLRHVFAALATEGAIVCGYCIIPFDSILWVNTYEPAAQGAKAEPTKEGNVVFTRFGAEPPKEPAS